MFSRTFQLRTHAQAAVAWSRNVGMQDIAEVSRNGAVTHTGDLQEVQPIFCSLYRAALTAPRIHHQHLRRAQSKAEQFNVIEQEAGLVRVDGCDAEGFIINGDRFVFGPLVCMKEHYASWQVRDLAGVTCEAFSFMDLIRPKPELLLIGTGSSLQRLPPALQNSLKSQGFAFDALDTANAIATFNILNQEAREVVGAFLPLSDSS